jgi:hypothetical protein
MPATFHIEEQVNEISVRVTEPRNYGRVIVIVLVEAVAGYFFLHASASRAFQAVICLVLAFILIKDMISSLRGTDVQLRVGNLDVLSSGHAPGGYTSSTISRADIDRFEYRKASGGGGEVPERPEGLYAEWSGVGPWSHSQCILPAISQGQADEVIEAIYKHFPNMGTLSQRKPYKSDLISLNLNPPAKR